MSRVGFVLAVSLCAAAAVQAGEMNVQVDGGANVRLLDSHFARYGYQPARTIVRETHGVRIRLPSGATGIGQTGLYSYFAVAGDFEVSAAYDLLDLPPPRGGYGVSCGIAVDTQGPGGMIALTRGQALKQQPGYTVTRGLPGDVGTKYETTHHPSTAKTGRLVLRREKAEVICLGADGPTAGPKELARLPFVNATVRQVRVFADPGGSDTAVDVRLTQVKVRAEEIAGGVPKLEPSTGFNWWLAGGGCLAATVAVVAIRRKRRGQWPWSEE